MMGVARVARVVSVAGVAGVTMVIVFCSCIRYFTFTEYDWVWDNCQRNLTKC